MTEQGIIGVEGAFAPPARGVVDAHSHLWIARPAGVAADLPDLQEVEAVTAELKDFRALGGCALVDCQPGGAGRNADKLAAISRASGVAVVACTGFHLPRYYPPGCWLLDASAGEACEYFVGELTQSLRPEKDRRAGFIKIAAGQTLDPVFARLASAAAEAARQTGAALGVHTERGALAEEVTDLLEAAGLPAERVVLFHMDKRPDLALHRRLALRGVLLEYDTFFVPKYNPDTGVWPLLARMVEAGLDHRVCIGTDMAWPSSWAHLGGSPGLAGLVTQIIPRMETLGFTRTAIDRMTRENILTRLTRIN